MAPKKIVKNGSECRCAIFDFFGFFDFRCSGGVLQDRGKSAKFEISIYLARRYATGLGRLEMGRGWGKGSWGVVWAGLGAHTHPQVRSWARICLGVANQKSRFGWFWGQKSISRHRDSARVPGRGLANWSRGKKVFVEKIVENRLFRPKFFFPGSSPPSPGRVPGRNPGEGRSIFGPKTTQIANFVSNT